MDVEVVQSSWASRSRWPRGGATCTDRGGTVDYVGRYSTLVAQLRSLPRMMNGVMLISDLQVFKFEFVGQSEGGVNADLVCIADGTKRSAAVADRPWGGAVRRPGSGLRELPFVEGQGHGDRAGSEERLSSQPGGDRDVDSIDGDAVRAG